MRLLEEARYYRHVLKWSVIPVRSGTKLPATAWKKYQDELIGGGELETVFADSTLNIGLATGKLSGLVVVDSDDYKANGGGLDLTSPLYATTPRGGKHLYFKYSGPVQNSVNADKAVDVRGDGGYVLLPPSAIEGKRYSWNTKPTPGLLEQLPELPVEVLESLRKQAAASVSTTSPLGFEKFDLAGAIGTGEGSRDDTLLRAALSILNGMPESEWSSKGYLLIQGANNTFSPPLPEHDVQRIFRQASTFVRNNPKTQPSQQPKATAVTTAGWTPKTFAQLIDEVKERRKRGEAKGIESGYEDFDRFTNGFQPGQTYLFFGDTNTGKSCLTLNFLMRMARMKTPVTYFDLENNALLTTERMVLIQGDHLTRSMWLEIKEGDQADEYMDTLKDLPFHLEDTVSLNERFGAITYEAVETVIKEQAAAGCKVFGIDHLHYFEPSEKNYGYLPDIAKKLNDLAGELNIVVLLVAHTRKGLLKEKDGKVQSHRPTTDDISGSGLISRHTKNVIGIMRNAASDDPVARNQTALFVDKTKSGNVGKLNLVFNPENLHFEEVST